MIEQAKNMISHAVPGGDWSDVFVYLAKKEIQKRTAIKTSKAKATLGISEKNANPNPNVAWDHRGTDTCSSQTPTAVAVAPARQVSRYIPAALRKSLLRVKNKCQYRDPQTGRICESQKFLQIDHIKSFSSGGESTFKNLQVLCGAHNRWKYSERTGI